MCQSCLFSKLLGAGDSLARFLKEPVSSVVSIDPFSLRDLAVESGVIAEGSIDSIMEGRQYKRGIRLHKLVYEALLRLAWRGSTRG